MLNSDLLQQLITLNSQFSTLNLLDVEDAVSL